MRLHLDFETFSVVDIGYGLDRYMGPGSDFEVTLTALAFDDDPVLGWDGIPIRFLTELSRIPGIAWHAFNAPFEMAGLAAYGIEVPRRRWRCTMGHAHARGFSGGLDAVGAQVGISHGKLDTGMKWIHKFSKPAPKNRLVGRYTAKNAPKDWQSFREYNIRDVVAERQVWRYLSRWPWTREEQQIWELDQRINRRGMPVDVKMATNAVRAAETLADGYIERVRELTGGLSPRQTAKLLTWCKEQGYSEDNLQAETIDTYLRENQ